jgi:hypothetical protein
MGKRQAMLVALGCGALLLLSGCSKKEETSSAGVAASPAASAPAAAPAAAAPASAAPAAGSIQSQDANQSGVAADLTECTRENGVLTIKIRFRNTTGQKVHLAVITSRNFESYYLTGGEKKYFVLKDSEGTYLMPQANGFGDLTRDLEAGQSWQFWAKFPAPPPEVKKITLMTPVTPPYDDVPITDK